MFIPRKEKTKTESIATMIITIILLSNLNGTEILKVL